jgi:glycosyltransferase involved in cell wall biosynthesis
MAASLALEPAAPSASLTIGLHDGGTPPAISWQAYAFHRFKRSFEARYAVRLEALRCPAVPGLVSIVLPVYNGAGYVRESIESVLQQTYTHFELIVIDDGSTDDTPAIVDEYARRDPRVRVIHQPNQRLPRALSNGCRLAQGEFLTWTSDDNRLKPDCLEMLVDCLRRHPDWDMVYANLDIIGPDGQPLINSPWYGGYQTPPGSEHISLPTETLVLNIVAGNTVGAAFMYRSRVDVLLGDYSRFRFGTEDYDYWMRVNALFTLRHADFSEPVYDLRFHSTSLTARDDELGITRSREGLMVFEDARRDFYLTPLAWIIGDDGSPQAREWAGRLRDWATAAGHTLVDQIPLDPEKAGRLWFPLVAVRVTMDPMEVVATPELPERAYKVLVMAAEAALPAEAAPSWDLCIATSPNVPLPRLSQPRQGWLAVSEVATLCTAIDIRVKSEHLAGLEAEITHPSAPVLKISVVISTYRRGAQLADAVRSVARQTLPAADYEVIVVNNDPLDASVGHIVDTMRRSEFSERPERLRLMTCPFTGLSFARNAGIAEAHGKVVSFLDDDAVAFTDWLERIWRAFEAFPQAGVVGGKIVLDPPDPRPKWLRPGWEHLWGHNVPLFGETKQVEKWWEFPWGGNWSATRQALLQIGGFRTNYGRRGVDFGGGEELVAATLIQRLGHAIVVAPEAQVYHAPSADRYTLKHVWKMIRAAELSEYREQIDLYVPGKPELSSLQDRMRERMRKIFARKEPFYRRLEHGMYAWAVTNVIRRLLKDRRERQRLYALAARSSRTTARD